MEGGGESEGSGAPSPRWRVLVLCALLFLCSQFYRVSLAVIAPRLQGELDLSAESLGLLSAVFFYAFAAVQIPLGFLLDRVGPRATMTVLSLVGSAGAVRFATAGAVQDAVMGQALLGIGMAGNLMGSMKLITHWFSPREFATLSGILMALGTLGNMLATTPLALLTEQLGWRWSFALIGVLTGLLAVIFFALVRDGPPDPKIRPQSSVQRSSLPRMLGVLLRRRDYWLISAGTFFRYGTLVAIQGLWAGPYLIRVVGLSPVEAGNLLLVLNMGVILGAPVGGWLSDRVLSSRKRVVLMGLAGMAIAELALSQGWGEGRGWVLGAIFFGLGVSSAFGQVMYAHIKGLMPAQMTGTALTGVNLFTMLGGATFLHGMGWVVDRWSASTGSEPQAHGAAFLMAFLGVSLALSLYLCTREVSPRGGNGEEEVRVPR
jgi:nitrate/nitrite transporter NarK